MVERPKSPVFIVGCHRSGTNLMYDTLISSGGFARVETPLYAYETLLPRFGNFAVREHRAKLMDVWLRSRPFRDSGLAAIEIRSRVMNECRSAGDFLCIVMGEIARLQNAERWAVWGPDNVLHIPRIKRDIPSARFIHVVRDGRDVALALSKMCALDRRPPAMDPCPRPLAAALGRSRALRRWLSDHGRAVLAAAIFWQRMVREGRRNGRLFPDHYVEIHYEDLVGRPRQTLSALSDFIGRGIDYRKVRAERTGTVGEPNSTFPAELENGGFNPIGRWKTHLSEREVRGIESLAGDCLKEFGYGLARPGSGRPELAARLTSVLYPRVLDLKCWLKYYTPLSQLVSLRGLELGDPPARNALDLAPASQPSRN